MNVGRYQLLLILLLLFDAIGCGVLLAFAAHYSPRPLFERKFSFYTSLLDVIIVSCLRVVCVALGMLPLASALTTTTMTTTTTTMTDASGGGERSAVTHYSSRGILRFLSAVAVPFIVFVYLCVKMGHRPPSFDTRALSLHYAALATSTLFCLIYLLVRHLLLRNASQFLFRVIDWEETDAFADYGADFGRSYESVSFSPSLGSEGGKKTKIERRSSLTTQAKAAEVVKKEPREVTSVGVSPSRSPRPLQSQVEEGKEKVKKREEMTSEKSKKAASIAKASSSSVTTVATTAAAAAATANDEKSMSVSRSGRRRNGRRKKKQQQQKKQRETIYAEFNDDETPSLWLGGGDEDDADDADDDDHSASELGDDR